MPSIYIAINAGLLVLIWLVQIIIYPGMHGWDRHRFVELHRDYCRRITFIVGPLMLAQAVLAVHQILAEPDPVSIGQTALIFFIWTITAFISVPLHRHLTTGYDARSVHRLITTNWLRTVGWSLISVLDWLG